MKKLKQKYEDNQKNELFELVSFIVLGFIFFIISIIHLASARIKDLF
tara:strand:+ start:1225 stop:1365 length:141 start_codon:yes stop_codon:yes gene_type:complete